MARLTVNQYTPITVGEHTVKLVEVESVQFENTFATKDKDGNFPARDCLTWKFLSNQEDEEGEPYQYQVTTGTAYGGARAGLTLLLDMLVPGITVAQAKNLDTDDLIGKRFKTMITMRTGVDGTKKPVHSYFAPLAKGAKPVQEVVEEAEEEAEEEVAPTPAPKPARSVKAKTQKADPFESE